MVDVATVVVAVLVAAVLVTVLVGAVLVQVCRGTGNLLEQYVLAGGYPLRAVATKPVTPGQAFEDGHVATARQIDTRLQTVINRWKRFILLSAGL